MSNRTQLLPPGGVGSPGRRAIGWRVLATLVVAAAVIMAPLGQNARAATMRASQTITFWTLTYQGGNDGVQHLVNDFMKANPGVTVKYSFRSDQTYKDTIRAAVQTSASPDVYEIFTGLAYSQFFVDNSAVIPLDQYYAQYNWTQRFGVAANTTKVHGKYYGVPWSIGPLALFYRKDLFAKAHIAAPPTTYAGLISDMDKLKAAGLIPLALGGKFSWNTLYALDNLMEHFCGTATFNALRTFKVKWTSQPCATQAFAELQSWVTKGYLPPGFLAIDPNGEVNGLMYSGKAAMVFAGGWLPGAIQQAGQDQHSYGVFGFPNGTGRQYEGSGQLQVAAKSQNPALAAKFIDFATSVAEQSKYYGALNGVVSVTVGAKPTGSSAKTSPLGPPMSTLLSQAQGLFTTTDLSTPPTIYNAVFQAQDSVVALKMTPAAAVKLVQQAVDHLK